MAAAIHVNLIAAFAATIVVAAAMAVAVADTIVAVVVALAVAAVAVVVAAASSAIATSAPGHIGYHLMLLLHDEATDHTDAFIALTVIAVVAAADSCCCRIWQLLLLPELETKTKPDCPEFVITPDKSTATAASVSLCQASTIIFYFSTHTV